MYIYLNKAYYLLEFFQHDHLRISRGSAPSDDLVRHKSNDANDENDQGN